MNLNIRYNPNKFIHVGEISLSEETKKLLKKSEKVYFENFDGKTWYGRCIFLSWYCSLGDCTFCFRSTQKHKIKHTEDSKRTMASVLLEALFCKMFNWRIEFLTGGYGIMPFTDLLEFTKNVSSVYGQKIWLNLGIISEEHLQRLQPYVKGICASMETLHPEIHKKTCPSKPIEHYDKMLYELNKSKKRFKKSIAVIIGLGDKIEDKDYLFDFIDKHKLDRITLYALKPIAGTEFKKGPDVEEYVQWIAHLRIRFPKLEIIAGTNLRRSEEAGYLMKAGANAVTKFPATKQFATKKAKLVEKLIVNEGRNFISNLSKLPEIDWNGEIDKLLIDEKYKVRMKEKLNLYLEKFENPIDVDKEMNR
ncbi:MAG: radical SAM protein [Nanoarchaeota archaeon]|nr:radical SAM protein [Nanoarchaeota archaeon]MBU1632140.1 radical SAM protein [Nanoarchaeota archaeon]MBU1876341.1 radical SAM protein [Nanoarchaeota archaeon]